MPGRKLVVIKWLKLYFKSQSWRMPPMRSDCSVAEVLDAYLVAYLKRMEKSGWPEGAVSLEALRSHLLRVLPEIWRLRDEGLSAEEIAVVDEYVIDYQILMSNNGLPMLPFCVAVADMWMEESR